MVFRLLGVRGFLGAGSLVCLGCWVLGVQGAVCVCVCVCNCVFVAVSV